MTSDMALTFRSDNPYFCFGCYYLIEATAVYAAEVTLYLHSIKSPMLLRENRYIKDTLEAG